MKLAVISCVVFTVISVLTGTADGAFTKWTEPPINAKDGSGTAATKIAEDKPVGATGVTLATDEATATITIVSQPTAGKLTISSGALSLATGFSFDFEKEPTYVIVVKAVAGADSGTATVTLSITNVNEAPVFSKSQYSVTIPDGSGAGTTLVSALATDPDAGQKATHTLDAAETDWTIDGTKGTITVAAAKKLDQTKIGGYKLVVTAVDDDATSKKTSSATVWVAVTTCSKASAVVVGLMTMILVVTSMLV